MRWSLCGSFISVMLLGLGFADLSLAVRVEFGASHLERRQVEIYISDSLTAIHQQMLIFEEPEKNEAFWLNILSNEEWARLLEARTRYRNDLEQLGWVLGQITEGRAQKGAVLRPEWMRVLMDFLNISGFWHSEYQDVFKRGSTLAKLAALKDCLRAGRQSNYFHYLDSLFEKGLLSEAKSLLESEIGFKSRDSATFREIKRYEESLKEGVPSENELQFLELDATLPGHTDVEFLDGKSLLVRRRNDQGIIGEARFDFLSPTVINGIHMSVIPAFRRSGLSKLFATIASQEFPEAARIETYLGLKNYEAFLENLEIPLERALSSEHPSLVDHQIKAAILKSPAGRIATELGFGEVHSYLVRRSDVQIVLVRPAGKARCEGAL